MNAARIILLGMFGLVCGCGSKPADTPSNQSPKQDSTLLENGQNLFEDITSRSGIRFVHSAGTNYFMPDQVGSGVALFDFDQDSRLDIYFVQNARLGSGVRNALYRQQPDGRFEDVSAGSGLDVSSRGMSAVSGDVNNDGKPDLVLTEYGGTKLFQNTGAGRFLEVTASAGIDNPRWAAPASFIDFDRDGWLDLVVANYVDYDPTQTCEDRQGRHDFCAPSGFPPTVTRLWRNITKEQGGTPQFEDWTVRSGIVKHPGMALGLVCADFTGDRWPDIFCSDDGRPNRLFINQRDGTFTEEAALRGLAYNAMGSTAANMGVAFADFNADGLGDLFVTHLTEEFHSLFQQNQPGLFLDTIAQSGMQKQAWRGTGFGTVASDFDLDGWPDIAFVNGLVRRASPGQTPVMSGIDPWWGRYAQRPQIFSNTGGRFHDVTSANPVFCGEAAVGRSLAVGDLDNDGALDLVLSSIGGPAKVYRNVAQDRGHWLKFRLIDPEKGGRDAIGAEVRFKADQHLHWNVLQPATSYLASNAPLLHFGLGKTAHVKNVEVVWPDGEMELFEVGLADRLITLKRGAGERKLP